MEARQLILKQIPIRHRTIRVLRSGVTLVIAVLVSALGTFAAETVQKAPPGTGQKAPPIAAAAATKIAPAVKIEALNLTVTPAQPKAGDPVTVKFTVRNAGPGAAAKVPWSIHLYTGNRTLAQGEQLNVAAGATFEVTAPWTPTAGNQRLQGYVDPTGKTLKNTAPPTAQVKELTVAVAPAATSQKATDAPAPKLVQQVLNYQKAKAAGARFSHGIDSGSLCNDLGQVVSSRPDMSVVFWARCGGPGGRATPEAFTGFQLKNGWKIFSVLEPVESQKAGSSDWQWIQRPSEGSSETSMKMRVWADPNSVITVQVKVVIAGPEGTDPYVASVR